MVNIMEKTEEETSSPLIYKTLYIWCVSYFRSKFKSSGESLKVSLPFILRISLFSIELIISKESGYFMRKEVSVSMIILSFLDWMLNLSNYAPSDSWR